jgi:hypothetical protein
MSGKVSKLVRELYQIDLDIKRNEDLINRMKARRHLLATVDLPEAMTEMGSSYTELSDGSGLICSVDFKVVGSLPKRDNPDARYAAIEYLRENDGEDIIKARLEVEFGKGNIRAANKLRRVLETRHMTDQPVNVDCDVHPQTLMAWGRERVKQNRPIKFEMVGLMGMTMATVKKSKDA